MSKGETAKVVKEIDIEQNIIGKISDEICCFENVYDSRPKMIIISRYLEVYLYNYCQCNAYQIINGEPMYMFFGIPCVVSNKLKDLEFGIF